MSFLEVSTDPAENARKLMFYIDRVIESTQDRPVPIMESVTRLVSSMSTEHSRFSEAGEVNVRVCILGDQQHCEEAKNLNVPYKDVDELKKLNKDVKAIEKLANKYDAFLVSESVMELIPELLGSALDKAGRPPVLLLHTESTAEKVETVKATISLKMKKVLCLLCLDGRVPH